jgi:hypothetical protein
MVAFIRPLRERREKLAGNKKEILQILKEGGIKARVRASERMKLVREKVGVELN